MLARALHVAALPFPSPQGTQAALLAILRAAARDARARGERVALLTYEAGDGRALLPPNVEHRRTRALVANRSLRSGPSLAKLAEDAAITLAVRRAKERTLFAHHVEAGVACALAARPFVWIAHTALGPELPLYLEGSARSSGLRAIAAGAGEGLDRLVARRALRVLAVSPWLARRIERRFDVEASVVPIPWSPHDPVSAAERESARDRLALSPRDEVILYAGNLDRYQGIETAIEALRAVGTRRPDALWLVATDSDPAQLRLAAERAGIAARLRLARLASDPERRAAHAAADLAIVPRRLEAGLSVKILEALAHGLPTIAVRAATGGLDFGRALVAVEDEPRAMEDAIVALLERPERRAALAREGHAHLARAHAADACVRALEPRA